MSNFDDIFEGNAPRKGQTNQPFDKEAWAEKKQAERQAVYDLADTTAEAVSADGSKFQAYLDVQTRFSRYSATNVLLILAQKPDATQLKDFDGWKDAGASIKRQQKGISILEPGEEYEREDGSIGTSYNVKRVFDISQTRAAQRPAPTTVRDERLLLKALMNDAPCRFAISNELPEGVNVAYHPQEHTVYVRQGLDAPTIFRGLAQELARAHMDRDGITCESPDFTAYSVSYMLCKRNGVSVEGFSFERLPESYAGMDARALRAEAGVMRDVAGSISADMNRLFAAQEKAQKNRDDEAR